MAATPRTPLLARRKYSDQWSVVSGKTSTVSALLRDIRLNWPLIAVHWPLPYATQSHYRGRDHLHGDRDGGCVLVSLYLADSPTAHHQCLRECQPLDPAACLLCGERP